MDPAAGDAFPVESGQRGFRPTATEERSVGKKFRFCFRGLLFSISFFFAFGFGLAWSRTRRACFYASVRLEGALPKLKTAELQMPTCRCQPFEGNGTLFDLHEPQPPAPLANSTRPLLPFAARWHLSTDYHHLALPHLRSKLHTERISRCTPDPELRSWHSVSRWYWLARASLSPFRSRRLRCRCRATATIRSSRAVRRRRRCARCTLYWVPSRPRMELAHSRCSLTA